LIPGPRRQPRFLIHCGLVLAALSFGAAATEASEESPIPPELQAQLLLNVLSFDRAFAERAGAELVVGVVIQRKYRPSLEAGEDLLAAFNAAAKGNMLGLPMRAVAVELGPDSDVGAELSRLEIDALYVTPLRALALDRISTATRTLKVRSLTAVSESVRGGLAIGLGMRDERPEVLVNQAAAQAEGSDFTAQLLRIARLVP
jgi:hypothetical protein